MAHNKKNISCLFYPLTPTPKFYSTDTGISGWPAISSDISIQICMSKSPQKNVLRGNFILI